MQNYLFVVFILFFFSFVSNSDAQINFQVGIGTSYTLANAHNDLVTEFNTANAFRLEEDFPALRVMSGIHLGLRYMVGNWGLDLSLQNLRRTRETYGEDGTILFEKKYYYTVNGLNAGVEFKTNKIISYGIGIGPRNVRIQRDIKNTDKRVAVIDKDMYQWNIKTYILFEFGGQAFTRFALRPYFDFPLQSISLLQLANDMELPNYSGDVDEFFKGIGISFIFYNGPQS